MVLPQIKILLNGRVSDGGFDITNISEMYLPSTPKIVGYNYWGVAIK